MPIFLSNFRLGLRLKFTLLVIFLLITVLAAQSFFLSSQNLNQARINLTNEVKSYSSLSTLQAGASFSQYYSENHFRFGEIIQSIIISSNKTITGLQIFNTEGDLLFDSKSLYLDDRENVLYKVVSPQKSFASPEVLSQIQKIDPSFNYSEINKSELATIVSPYLESYNQHRYTIRYLISYQRIYEKLASEILNVTLLASVTLVVASILIVFFVNIFMLKPIRIVAKNAQSLEHGELNNVLNIKTHDEIEDLAHSFNQMAQSLIKSEQSIKLDRDTIALERDKLEIVLSGITDAVIAVDLKRRVIIFNRIAENLTGFKKEEVLGKLISEVIQVYDKEDIIAEEAYAPILSETQDAITFNRQNLKIKTPRKELYANLVTGQIKEGATNNLGCILTLHDITKEKELEVMKIDFVSMAAHELRTPLTAVKGYLYIFVRDYAKSLDTKQSAILSRISIATQRLVSLVENLLNVAKIERGTLTLKLTPLDWGKNIEESIAEIITQAVDKKIALNFIKPRTFVFVLADKFRINEVLSNLLENAIFYTGQGGKITVWLEDTGNEIITHIQDTGEGIPKEALPHLFTKFFRVSGSLEQGSKGTGLGLYIAKSVVQLHRGRIWVNSEFGKGSTFSFSLLKVTH